MTTFTLYGTSACHLCECAEAILADLLVSYPSWQIELVDIAEDDALIEQYGIRIPVLRLDVSGEELGWPFDAAAVQALAEKEGAR